MQGIYHSPDLLSPMASVEDLESLLSVPERQRFEQCAENAVLTANGSLQKSMIQLEAELLGWFEEEEVSGFFNVSVDEFDLEGLFHDNAHLSLRAVGNWPQGTVHFTPTVTSDQSQEIFSQDALLLSSHSIDQTASLQTYIASSQGEDLETNEEQQISCSPLIDLEFPEQGYDRSRYIPSVLN